MHAQRYGWQIQWQESMQDMAHWVVVIGHKGVWHRNAVVPALMQTGQHTTSRRVQQVRVNVILYRLICVSPFTHHDSLLLKLTFLANSPITACLIIVHGYGK
jgi:hypothetical protein